MEFTQQQRRTLIALACKLAWADGVVSEEERAFVRGMVTRFASEEALGEDELETWLDEGPPEAELDDLPKGIDDLFVFESMRLMESDGEIDDRELELLESIISRTFNKHPEGTTLARITLTKRAIPLPRTDEG